MKSITLSIADVSLSVTPCVGVWIEIEKNVRKHCGRNVTPCVGVWIEILKMLNFSCSVSVTPCVGVWIEISMNSGLKGIVGGSLPVWECGLKFTDTCVGTQRSPTSLLVWKFNLLR